MPVALSVIREMFHCSLNWMPGLDQGYGRNFEASANCSGDVEH